MKLLSFIVSSFLISSFVYAKGMRCGVFLTDYVGQEDLANSTERFLSYLSYLTNGGIVKLDSLRNLAEEIKVQGRIVTNPVPHQITSHGMNFTQIMFQIHYENLNDHLKQRDLNYEEILRWTLRTIEDTEKVRARKNRVKEQTKIAWTEMKLHPVTHGEFWMRKKDKKFHVILTHDIEVMSTPVTQWMWGSEMKKNPANFKNGPESISVDIDGQKIQMIPDNPVETITWYSAAWYANHMSRKHNLPEVYDFNEVIFKVGTSAEDGTLDIEDGEVKIRGKNIYETQGYRLPTEAEQKYLLSDRGRSTTDYFTDVTEKNLSAYAWFDKNSNKQTHQVSEKLATIIDGYDFYDLMGNVWEWGNDLRDAEDELAGGKDPDGLARGPYRVLSGGGWLCDAVELCLGHRSFNSPTRGNVNVGFRLVRTVK